MINFITFPFKGGLKMIIVQAKAIPKDEKHQKQNYQSC